MATGDKAVTTLHCLGAVLDAQELEQIRAALSQTEFTDGALTAGYRAKRVKHNLQAKKKTAPTDSLDETVLRALRRHKVFKRVAVPHRIRPPLFSRYTEGMNYGNHVDDAVMGRGENKVRTDLAVTVFLSEQSEYDGGELMVGAAMGELAVKLPAGDAVIYEASTLHRVNPVTRGERLAAVTWVQSLVRDTTKRSILADLDELRLALHERLQPEADLAFKSYANLLRLWSEL